MYIERLDENRIKVTVGDEDIKKWNVDLSNFIENTAEAQEMFWSALKQAEREVNFKVNNNSQLVVETIPNGEQGFFLYISLIRDESELTEAIEKSGKQVTQTELKPRRRTRNRSNLSIFRFNDFEDLCQGAGAINERFVGRSRVVKHRGEFYLELMPHDSFGVFETENILSEFADKVKQPSLFQGLLNEYGKTLIEEDAVSVIATYFK